MENPVLLTSEFFLVAGQFRVEAAERLGFKTINYCLGSDLTMAQVRAFILSENHMTLGAAMLRSAGTESGIFLSSFL
jgi:hypothetical protein